MKTTVDEIMVKKLIVAQSGTSIKRARQIMDENRIRHLPIAGPMDEIVGIISNRDLNNLSEEMEAKNIPVDFLMTSPVFFIPATTPLRSAVLKMLELKISCLLITDPKEDVVGIITSDDLLWYLAHLLKGEKEGGILSAVDVQTIGSVINEINLVGI